MATFSIRSFIPVALFTATAASILFSPPSHATTSPPKQPKAACRIEVDNAHISTSLVKHRKLKYVKVNARSICNVPQQRVTLTLEIYKIGLFGDHFVHRFETKEYLRQSAGLRVEIKDATVRCKNNEVTNYFGVAYAKAIIESKWQYAGRTRSRSNIPLHCGT